MSGKKINKVPLIDLKREYQEIKREIDESASRVLSGGWFIFGEELISFEEEFAKYLGVKYAVGVNSGTDALHLALLSIGIGPGDEVITSSHTFIATVLAIYWVGAKPVLVDIDEENYNLNPLRIEEKINSRTKAILPVHLYGYPCDMEKIMKLAKKYRLKVIEDACQAHGSIYQDKKVGGFGQVGCFSFYPSKNLGAFGDAGAIVTNDEQVYQKLKLLRNYGQEKKYVFSEQGYNSRLDEIQASFLRVKLKKLEEWNQKRRVKAARYRKNLRDLPITLPPEDDQVKRGNCYVFVIRTDKREALQSYLDRAGITTVIHYPVPVHKQESCRGLSATKLPVTEKVADEVLSLPIFPQITDEEIDYVSDRVRDFFK